MRIFAVVVVGVVLVFAAFAYSEQHATGTLGAAGMALQLGELVLTGMIVILLAAHFSSSKKTS